MKLRHKFGVLTLIYVVSLSLNLGMSCWCIVVYFQSAFVDFQSTLVEQAMIGRLQSLARRQADQLERGPVNSDTAEDCRRQASELSAGVARLGANLSVEIDAASSRELDLAAQRAEQAVGQYVAAGEDAAPDTVLQALTQVDRALGRVGARVGLARQSAMERAHATQRKVVGILIVNSVGGMLLCLVGVALIRRWVLRPVADLRVAAKEISKGRFGHRIRPASADELGQLAEEVNGMSATIVEMQTKLVEQERLAAAGEMVTRLAHNIRNPLAGIRGLAEATLQHRADDLETRDNQRRIIDSIDRFEKWLRDLQHSVSPLKLNVQPVAIGELASNVCRALRPMADRRGVRVEMDEVPADRRVRVDSFHFEQALVALVTNAIQASPSGQPVKVSVSAVSGAPGRWRLTVQDQGDGIPRALQEKVFHPYFTTKPGGNGVGLAIANKVVRIHGGNLKVRSDRGRGCRFEALLPGLVTEKA